MSSLLLAAVVLLLIPVIFAYPYVGIFGWFWISFMNPHQEAWGPASDLPFAAIIAGTTLIAWLLGREPKRMAMTPVTWMLLLLAVWITWTTTQAQYPDGAWKLWDRAIKILLMTGVAIALLRSRERIHAAVWVTVISLGYYAIQGGLFTILTGGENRVFGPPNSFIADNNALALATLMTAPLLRYLYLHSAVAWVRWGLGASLVLFVFSAIGSQSRGAFLTLLAMGMFLVWKSRYRARMMLGAMAVALVAVWFVPDSWVERMETIKTYEEDGSAMARIRAWKWAVDLANRWPLTGGGFEISRDVPVIVEMLPGVDPKQVFNMHSIYFEVLGQHGYIGFIIFMVLIFSTWRMFSKTIRYAREHEDLKWAEDLAAMCQVSLVAYCVGGAFLNLAFFDLFYLFVALSVVLPQTIMAADAQPLSRSSAATPAGMQRPGRRLSASTLGMHSPSADNFH